MAEESDPFECRLTFLSLLQKLNASQQSIHKVASYAMRHRKLSEDLYSCLIEVLEQVKYRPFSKWEEKSCCFLFKIIASKNVNKCLVQLLICFLFLFLGSLLFLTLGVH